MANLKASEIDGFLKRPNDRWGVVLVYGTDDGLAAERAGQIVKAASGGSDDPFSVVRLSGEELVSDPARLVDEARTVSLFGSKRVVWVRDCGARNILPAVQPLLDDPATGSLVVLEAGDLKKTAALRKKIEDSSVAAAIGCYADDPREISRLVDQELADSGLTIDRDAREILEAHLGGDRLASRGELRKLCLYCHGQKRVAVADVEAIVGDASGLFVDAFVDAVAGGDPEGAVRVLARLEAAGTRADMAVSALMRHFQLLERLRNEIKAGRPARNVVDGVQPAIFFRRKAAIERQLGLWSPDRITRAAGLLDQAFFEARRSAPLASSIASDVALTLARAAKSAGRR